MEWDLAITCMNPYLDWESCSRSDRRYPASEDSIGLVHPHFELYIREYYSTHFEERKNNDIMKEKESSTANTQSIAIQTPPTSRNF